MQSKLEQFFARHGYALGAILIIASGIFGFFKNYRPFGPDDLMILSLAARPDPGGFFLESLTDFLPMYRPITYLLIWIQYQFTDISPAPYYIANILIFIGCAIVLYFLVYKITASRLASITASLLLLVEIRAASALYWIGERQTTLALLFGSLAILLFIRAQKNNKLTRPIAILIFVCLLFSTLSKEYGLSFTATIVVISLTSSPPWKLRASLLIAFFVVLTYFVMRFGIAQSYINADYCENIGYRTETLRICYNDYEPNIRKNFYLWNVGSTFVGTFFPMLFTGTGQWAGFQFQNNYAASLECPISFANGIFSILLIAFVSLSLYKFPRKSLPFLAIIIFNAILSFLLYRPRNHLMALLGLYTLLGIGIYALWSIVKQRQFQRILFIIIMILLCFIISSRVIVFSQFLDEIAASYSLLEPCNSAREWHHPQIFNMDIIRQLKINYKMSNPECQPGGWKTWRLKSLDISK